MSISRWLGEPVQVHWDHEEYLLYRSGLTHAEAEKYDEDHDDPYADGLVIEIHADRNQNYPIYNVLIDRTYFAFNSLSDAEQCLADCVQENGIEPLEEQNNDTR